MLRLWHPLRDPYHCTFRLLTLLRSSPEATQSLSMLSLLDFLWLFPYFITNVQMVKAVRQEFRHLGFPERKDSYAYLPSIKLLYRELQPLQRTALHSMASRGFLDVDAYRNGHVILSTEKIPQELLSHLEGRIESQNQQLHFLINRIGTMDIDGSDGLLRKLNLGTGGKLR